MQPVNGEFYVTFFVVIFILVLLAAVILMKLGIDDSVDKRVRKNTRVIHREFKSLSTEDQVRVLADMILKENKDG